MQLGADQRLALQEMSRLRGIWSQNCGWQMHTLSRTVTIMEALEKKGAVQRTSTPGFYPGAFEITDAGRAALARFRP